MTHRAQPSWAKNRATNNSLTQAHLVLVNDICLICLSSFLFFFLILLLLSQSFWKFIQESVYFCSAEFTSNFSYGVVFLGHTRYICSDVSCHSAGNIFYDVMCREKPWPNTRESSFLDILVVINEKKISYLWKTFRWRVVNQNQCIHNDLPYPKENTCSLKRSILLRSLLAGG